MIALGKGSAHGHGGLGKLLARGQNRQGGIRDNGHRVDVLADVAKTEYFEGDVLPTAARRGLRGLDSRSSGSLDRLP